MVTDNTNPIVPLMPDRHPQHDLFICDVADAVLKDVMAHMEHPFYSLSKKPEPGLFTEPRLSGGALRFQGPGRPLPKVLSRIW